MISPRAAQVLQGRGDGVDRIGGDFKDRQQALEKERAILPARGLHRL